MKFQKTATWNVGLQVGDIPETTAHQWRRHIVLVLLGKVGSSIYCWPWEEYTCKKGLLVVNWTQIHNKNVAAIVCRGPSYILYFREKPQSGLPASCTALLQSESALRRDQTSTNRTETFSIQLELRNYILISSSLTIQIGSIPISQDSVIWIYQTVRIWSLNLHINGPISDVWWALYISQLHLYLNEAHFQFPLKTVFPD